jgi:hypothetical protein
MYHLITENPKYLNWFSSVFLSDIIKVDTLVINQIDRVMQDDIIVDPILLDTFSDKTLILNKLDLSTVLDPIIDKYSTIACSLVILPIFSIPTHNDIDARNILTEYVKYHKVYSKGFKRIDHNRTEGSTFIVRGTTFTITTLGDKIRNEIELS